VLGIWATCALGFWQLRRAGGKEALQHRIDAAQRAPATLPDAQALREPDVLVYHHLRFKGRWEPERVVYLDNRPQAGQPGFYVLMPLHIDRPIVADVIVNRGWTPRNINDRTAISPYRTSTDEVDIAGVVLAEEPRLLELTRPPQRSLKGIWQNFDFDEYARASSQAPLRMIVRQDHDLPASGLSSDRADDGLVRDWPDHGGTLQGQIDRHHGYAFQWFAMAAALASFLLYQIFRVIKHGRPTPN
jgi:surfeit locus 1 family protein